MFRRTARLLGVSLALQLLFAAGLSAAPSTGSRLYPDEVQDLLRVHNRARADVGVPPLRWSPQVAGSAQRWADRLAGSSCSMQHSRGSGYGENLYRATAGYYEVKDAALAWAREERTAEPFLVLSMRNWMEVASVARPMMPPRASISFTSWPLASPPMAGLHDMSPMVSRLIVTSNVAQPMAAEARQAS